MCASYTRTQVCMHMLPTLISEFSVDWELAGSSRLTGQEALESCCLHLPITGFRDMHQHTWFPQGYQTSELRFLGFSGRHFTK